LPPFKAIFRDEVAEGLRCTLFQPNTEVKKAINQQASLYKDRLKQYNSDREVRGRGYEERLAIDHKREYEKERSYKAMLADVRRGRRDAP